MKTIYKLIMPLLTVVVLAGCGKDDCGLTHYEITMQDIPNVIDGTFPVGTVYASVGDEIVFAPQLVNPDGVTAVWELNGVEVPGTRADGNPCSYTYRVDKPCLTTVRLLLKKNNATVEMQSEISCMPDLSRGFLVLSGNGLDFYDKQCATLYTDIYSSLNGGAGLVSGLEVTKHGGRLLLSKSTNIGNVKHLYSVDAQTLKLKRDAQIATDIGRVIPLNGDYGIVSGGFGIYRVNLNTLLSVQIRNQYFYSTIYCGAVSGGKLFANMAGGYINAKMRCFDVDELLAAGYNELDNWTEIDVLQNGITGVVADAAGNVYTIGYDDVGSSYYFAAISPDLTITKTPLPFTPAIGRSKTIALSKDGLSVYIPAADHSIYRYVVGDASSLSQRFIAPEENGHELSGRSINVDPADGTIYVCYHKSGVGGCISAFDAAGSKTASIDCGDAKPQDIIF